MKSRAFNLFLFGLLMSTAALNAICTRCMRTQHKRSNNAAPVKRSKGWRPVSAVVINNMPSEQRRKERMNNKRKKAIPVATVHKRPADSVKKSFPRLS